MIKHSANKLTTEDRQSILEGLLDCDSQEEFWWGIISDLPPEIKLGFDRSASIKERVDNLVKKALEFPNGIETLISRVRFKTSRNMAWYRLAKLAFRLICDQTKTTNDEELANRLVDLVEKINPERTTIERICKELSLDSPERRKFINAYDVILTLFQQEDKSQALAFVRKLAQPEISGDQSEDLQTWLEQTHISVEGTIPYSPDDRTARPKRRLNIEQYGSPDEREIKGANQYLLGERFVGRKKELVDLTDWLGREGDRILCICDLGGTGKSALVWHWLNSESTKKTLDDQGIKETLWSTFYARNFDSMQFLRDLAKELGGATIVESDTYRAQRRLQEFILDRLRKEKWLLVLDGLEREMGAFANPEHSQIDSEEQDRRNENGNVLIEEKYIRGYVFPDFLIALLKTSAKVLITSRIFPENLMFGDRPFPGVIPYPFSPLSFEDATDVWDLAGEPDSSAFQKEFFKIIGYHPQVISVVSAAVKEQSLSFMDWFNDFTEADRQTCLESNTVTARRHGWLDLATRDLTQDHRDAWLTLCYIVRRSEASNVDALEKALVDSSQSNEGRPGRFRSKEKLIELLKYLEKRRLIGTDFTKDLVDVHPVIRGQVMRYILKQFEPGGKKDEELLQHIESGDVSDLLLRILSQPDLEERFQSLSNLMGEFKDSASPQNFTLRLLGRLYTESRPGISPWLGSLPALRLRKDQALALQRTANELMTRGQWDDSAAVFKRAIMAFYLCGDLQSVEDCRRSHDWQILYGGSLRQAENHLLDELEKPENLRSAHDPYWLALLLAIRQSQHARELLESLPTDESRWTLQTVAESWFYLEDYEKAAVLAQQALDRRDKEDRTSVGQLLWEKVTLGLALVRMEKGDEAIEHLDFANSRGMGWCYNIVPMFAMAGLIEYQYHEAMKISRKLERQEKLSRTDFIYKQYCKSDPVNQFQIPAAEAHLAMARVHLARREHEDANNLALMAFKIADGQNPRFHYASVVKRARLFLTEELKQPVPIADEPNLEVLDHEDRLEAWIKARRKTER